MQKQRRKPKMMQRIQKQLEIIQSQQKFVEI